MAWWLRDDMMVMIEWHDVRRTECYHPPHPPTPPRTLPAYLCQRMMKCVSSRLHDDGMMIAWWNDGDDMIACQRMMKCVWWKWARLHGRFSGRQHKHAHIAHVCTVLSDPWIWFCQKWWYNAGDSVITTPPKMNILNLKMDPWKRRFLLDISIFRFHSLIFRGVPVYPSFPLVVWWCQRCDSLPGKRNSYQQGRRMSVGPFQHL